MSRRHIVLLCFGLSACPGFTIDDADAGPTVDPTLDAGPDAASDVGRVADSGAHDGGPGEDAPDVLDVGTDAGSPPDAGPCTIGEACDDLNACTEGEMCTSTGCTGGVAIECAGASTFCEDDVLVTETRGPACEAATGCVLQREEMNCPFSCAAGRCVSCVSTSWTQTTIPVTFQDGGAHITNSVIDASGGHHVVFPTDEMGAKFLEGAIHYAYRTGDGATWTVEGVTPPGPFTSDTSIAVHNGEPHILTVSNEVMTYWHRVGGVFTGEEVPGRAIRDSTELVVTDDGQVHVLRGALSGVRHLQRIGGTWTDDNIDSSIRFGDEVSAITVGNEVHVVFRNGSDGIGYGFYDGFAWVFRPLAAGAEPHFPRIAVHTDGTVKIVFALEAAGDLAVGTLTPAGSWSAVAITNAFSRIGREHDVAIDVAGGTHVVFRTTSPREVHYGYSRPGGNFVFDLLVAGTAFSFNLDVDALGKVRMVSEHILPIAGSELRFSERQSCP